MNKLAAIIEELGVQDLQLLRKDVEAGNLLRVIDQRLQKLQTAKTCPTCGSELLAADIRFAFEFGPTDLRQKAYFDEYDCLQYFLEHTLKTRTP